MIHRVYDPEDGRFLHRDPIGVWTDGGNFGNGYGYVGGDPISLLDPYGEKISCTVDMEGSSPCVASETDWCKQLKGILEESQKKLDDITKNVCQGKESSTRCKTWKGIRDVLNLKGEKTYEIVVCGCENPPTNSRCEIACRKNKPGSKPAAVTYPTRKEEANRMYLCCQSLSAYSRGRHDIMKTIVHESAHIVQKHDKTQGHKTEPSSLDKQKTGTEQEEWMSKNAGHPEDAYSYEVDWTTGGSATKFDYNRDANKRYQIWRREEKGSN